MASASGKPMMTEYGEKSNDKTWKMNDYDEMTEECIHCHEAIDAEIIEVCHCCNKLACPWCIDERFVVRYKAKY